MAFEMKALWFHVLGFDAAKIPNKRKRQVVDFVLLFTNASEINLDTKNPDRLPPLSRTLKSEYFPSMALQPPSVSSPFSTMKKQSEDDGTPPINSKANKRKPKKNRLNKQSNPSS